MRRFPFIPAGLVAALAVIYVVVGHHWYLLATGLPLLALTVALVIDWWVEDE